MLRLLAMLAVLLTGVPVVDGQEIGSPSAAHKNNTKDTKQDSGQSASSTVIVVKQESPANQGDGSAKNPKEYFTRLFTTPENFPNIVLVLAGIAGIWIGVCTLRTLKRQTKATWIAAKASLRQANHIATADRAWIIEKIDFPEVLPFQRTDIPGPVLTTYVAFEIKNVGRTVAVIKTFNVRFHTAPAGQLPATPYYGDVKMREIGEYGFPIAPGEPPTRIGVRLEDSLSLSEEQAIAIANEVLFLYAYGRVEYETIGRNRTTQFCYVWHVPKGLVTANDPTRFRKGGPPEYNKVT